MKLIPGENSFIIHTRLARKEVIQILKEAVLEKRPFFPFFPAKDWQGDVYHSGFDIRATQGFKLYLPPVFHGEFGNSDNELTIRVKACSPLASFRVAVFWACCGAAVLGLIYGVPQLYSQKDPNAMEMTGILLMFAVLAGGCAFYDSKMYWKAFDRGKQWLVQTLG